MNHVTLLGRITKDPEVKKTNSGISVCSFTLAVDRRFKNASGERETDFIPCVGWRQVADIIGQYFRKGSRIAITGTIQTRSYEDNAGQRRNVVEVLAEEIDFIDKKEVQEEEIRPIPPMPKVEPLQSNEENDVQLPFDIMGME